MEFLLIEADRVNDEIVEIVDIQIPRDILLLQEGSLLFGLFLLSV
jgi:hypothetical protein